MSMWKPVSPGQLNVYYLPTCWRVIILYPHNIYYYVRLFLATAFILPISSHMRNTPRAPFYIMLVSYNALFGFIVLCDRPRVTEVFVFILRNNNNRKTRVHAVFSVNIECRELNANFCHLEMMFFWLNIVEQY